MERDEALNAVETVSVSASEKKILEDYEPTTAHVEFEARVEDDMDPVELERELGELAQEEARRQVMERWEAYLRREAENE